MDHLLMAKISTLSVLLPIGAGSWVYRHHKAEGHLRLFLLFLVFGFLIDCMGWYQYVHDLSHWVFNLLRRIYGLAEAIFFIWLISKGLSGRAALWCKGSLYLLIPGWLFFEILIPYACIGTSGKEEYAVFQALYRILATFFSAYALLKLAETGAVRKVPLLWLLFGTFTYNLTTFFMMIFQHGMLGERLWFIHDVSNITGNLFYACGFYVYSATHSLFSKN